MFFVTSAHAQHTEPQIQNLGIPWYKQAYARTTLHCDAAAHASEVRVTHVGGGDLDQLVRVPAGGAPIRDAHRRCHVDGPARY
jgi:hypothetical protein